MMFGRLQSQRPGTHIILSILADKVPDSVSEGASTDRPELTIDE